MTRMRMFCVYFNKLHALDGLPLETYAKVIKALAHYEETGEEMPVDDPMAALAVRLLMADADSISGKDEGKSTKSQAGKKGAEKRWGKNNENISSEEDERSSDQEDDSSDESTEMTESDSESSEIMAEIAENSKDSTAISAIQQTDSTDSTDSLKKRKEKESKGVYIGRSPRGTSADKGRIIPPTQEMIAEYCTEKGYDQRQGVRFYNFYGSKDWKVGKERMKNWHMALANWMAPDNSYGGSPQAKRQEAEDPYSGYTRL